MVAYYLCWGIDKILIFIVMLNNHMIPRTAPPTSNSVLSLIQDWWRVQDSLNGSWSL